VAVLGSGIDVPYPKENWDLYDLMAERGLIVSEFMPGTPPLPGHFPVRNRIISGISRGVLVVEAGLRSGSLITARHAVEQNRDVFVVPGSALSPVSEGCHDLIRRGARVVFSAEDILLELTPVLQEEHQVLKNSMERRSGERAPSLPAEARLAPAALPWDNSPAKAVDVRHLTTSTPLSEKHLAELCVGLDPLESEILKLLNQFSSCHIDKISSELGQNIARLSGTLTMLEIRGLIKHAPGMLYSLT
jgi:DNA processing protein